MRKVSALFLAIAIAASVNVQAASFWDWLNGWGETPKRGMMKTVCESDFGDPRGNYCFDTK